MKYRRETLTNRICVFAAANEGTTDQMAQAYKLGGLIAETDRALVFGGFNIGLMGEVAAGARAAGGEVIGVVPHKTEDIQMLSEEAVASLARNDEVIGSGSLQERKHTMLRMSDAVISLAGGIGTFDELATTIEVSRGGNIGAAGRLAVVNTDGFYEGLRMQLDRMHDDGLARVTAEQCAYFAADAADAMAYVETAMKAVPLVQRLGLGL